MPPAPDAAADAAVTAILRRLQRAGIEREVQADLIATLTAAVATMADRMATSTLKAALNSADFARHLDACSRQRRAMHRLMDALNRARGGDEVLWGLAYMRMVERDDKRTAARRAAQR
jgi:hypothetical protein